MELSKTNDLLFESESRGGAPPDINDDSSDNDSTYSDASNDSDAEENRRGDSDDDDDDDVDDDDDDDDDDIDPENLEMLASNTKANASSSKQSTAFLPNDNDSDDDENQQNINEDSDDDDTDEEDDDYLQKFSHHINTNHLEKLHPGIQSCNNDEVVALSRVVRDAKGRICDPMHTTAPFLTKYERARIVGARAEQLDRGAVPMIKLDPEIINGRVIAQMELEQKKIPFVLARPLPNGKTEYWRIEDLEVM
jgi:DNA-directed RNA polymerase I, II, and III subunit RPABC2